MSDTRMKSPTITVCPSSPATGAHVESPIIYIMVVGFHHKLGCQLEFVYPENKLIKKNTAPATAKSGDIDLFTLPKRWAHLPSLALPDGSHNYNSDYIYFHLEDEDSTVESLCDTADNKQKKSSTKKKLPNRTLFGISCYRQINASEMINKDSNVTRNTLQKSVCILSTCPLYATSIRLKLHSITCAYFEQKDFHRTQILIDAFNTTFRHSSAFSDYSINYKKSADENLIGLSLSDLVVRYQHKILVLFKLILLQKKCLFQLKPVSNLSNTIISLISLIPDIFHPSSSSSNGLEHCSGFFDSIDLVNSELERKANAKSKALLATRNGYSKSTAALNSSASKKVKKKRMLSFSSKSKKSSSNQLSSGSLSSSSSPMSSMSSSPISSNANQQQLSQISSNCQRLYESTLNASSSSHTSTASSNGTTATSDAIHQSKENNNPLNWSDGYSDKVATAAATATSLSSTTAPTKSTSHITSTPQTKASHRTSHLRLSLKKKKKSPSTPQSPQTHDNQQLDITGNSSHSSTTATTTTAAPESPTSTTNGKQLQLEELLGIDFGMPFNLFSQFNILHPYLSLYYLDYFTGINKMNTKLYCTTSLMLSMMSAANNPEADAAATEAPAENGDINSNSSSMASSSGCSSYTNAAPKAAAQRPGTDQQNLTIGYTIGATNALFKQRLYDDIDVFVDESTIDLKQNEALKKQLQLSTADLRFADYLLKHVNASRSSQQKAMSNNQNNNTPTLLSVKKTSNSFSEVDDASMASPSLLSSSNWEGSDEWIRLNFKWYFYTLLGSMVKEQLCAEVRNEAELLVGQLAWIEACLQQQQQQQQAHEYSSSSSSVSLANEVVDIDDYIERASVKSSAQLRGGEKNLQSNMKMSSAKHSSYSLNPASEKNNGKSTHKSQRKDSDQETNGNNQNLLLSQQAQSYLGSSAPHMAYQEDFNAGYIGEFRRTECFQDWCEANRKRLEQSLFKLDELPGEDVRMDTHSALVNSLQSDSEPATQADLALVSSKLQATLKKLQHLESVKVNHPFSGTMGVHDIKLRFNFLFTATDSGKKINKALAEGSKIMNTTGRAVGDALSQAKSSFSSLWSNWSGSSPNSSLSSSRNNKSASHNTSTDANQKFTNLS